jgi:molecular chaperone DnaK
MVAEAAEHEAEDKARRETVERRNKLDNMCYQLEKSMTENKDKLQAADVELFEKLIKQGREAVEKQDDAQIESALEALEKEAHRLASVMYGAQTPGGAPGTDGTPNASTEGVPPGGKKKDSGVIDAEFEETTNG